MEISQITQITQNYINEIEGWNSKLFESICNNSYEDIVEFENNIHEILEKNNLDKEIICSEDYIYDFILDNFIKNYEILINGMNVNIVNIKYIDKIDVFLNKYEKTLLTLKNIKRISYKSFSNLLEFAFHVINNEELILKNLDTYIKEKKLEQIDDIGLPYVMNNDKSISQIVFINEKILGQNEFDSMSITLTRLVLTYIFEKIDDKIKEIDKNIIDMIKFYYYLEDLSNNIIELTSKLKLFDLKNTIEYNFSNVNLNFDFQTFIETTKSHYYKIFSEIFVNFIFSSKFLKISLIKEYFKFKDHIFKILEKSIFILSQSNIHIYVDIANMINNQFSEVFTNDKNTSILIDFSLKMIELIMKIKLPNHDIIISKYKEYLRLRKDEALCMNEIIFNLSQTEINKFYIEYYKFKLEENKSDLKLSAITHFKKHGLIDENYLTYFFSLYGSKTKYINDYFNMMFKNVFISIQNPIILFTNESFRFGKLQNVFSFSNDPTIDKIKNILKNLKFSSIFNVLINNTITLDDFVSEIKNNYSNAITNEEFCTDFKNNYKKISRCKYDKIASLDFLRTIVFKVTDMILEDNLSCNSLNSYRSHSNGEIFLSNPREIDSSIIVNFTNTNFLKNNEEMKYSHYIDICHSNNKSKIEDKIIHLKNKYDQLFIDYKIDKFHQLYLLKEEIFQMIVKELIINRCHKLTGMLRDIIIFKIYNLLYNPHVDVIINDSLSTVTLDIDFNQTKCKFIVSPLAAKIILMFDDEKTIEYNKVVNSCINENCSNEDEKKEREKEIEEKINFWIKCNVLYENTSKFLTCASELKVNQEFELVDNIYICKENIRIEMKEINEKNISQHIMEYIANPKSIEEISSYLNLKCNIHITPQDLNNHLLELILNNKVERKKNKYYSIKSLVR